MRHAILSLALVPLLFGSLKAQVPADGDLPPAVQQAVAEAVKRAVIQLQDQARLHVDEIPAPDPPPITIRHQPPVVTIGPQVVETVPGPPVTYAPPVSYAPQQQYYQPPASVMVQAEGPARSDIFKLWMFNKMMFRAKFRRGLLPRRYVVRRDHGERQIDVLRFWHNYDITPRQ